MPGELVGLDAVCDVEVERASVTRVVGEPPPHNNGWPFLHNITFTASDPGTKEMRVWLRKNGDPENYWEPELSMMPGDATTEHYNPKLAVHQGDGLQGPLFALVRNAVDGAGSVRVVGRTYHWWFDPQLGPGPPDDPEQFVTG